MFVKKLFVLLLFFSAVFCYGLPEITETSASSELSDAQGSYSAENLIDHTWRSWAEGVRGNGVGESFLLVMSSRETITGFAIKNRMDFIGARAGIG